MRKLIAALLMLIAAPVWSTAPFCAVFSWGDQCFYYDAQSCRQAAGASGACIVNPNRGGQQGNQFGSGASRPSSGPPFCVVASFGTQCFYYDAQSCRQAASSANGMCVVNPGR